MALYIFTASAFSYASASSPDSLATALPELTVEAIGSLSDVASSTPRTEVNNIDFARLGVNSTADILRHMPGVNIKDYGGAGGTKTVAVRGLGAQHTGLDLDGIAITDARNGQIDLNRFSLSNIAGMTMTIGDSDDIFIPARNASTPAMVSIRTLTAATARTAPSAALSLRQGSFGLYGGSMAYSQNISDRIALSAAGEFTHARNDYPYTVHNLSETITEHRKNSMLNTGSARFNALARTSESGIVGAGAYYFDSYRQLPGQVRYYTTLSSQRLRERSFIGRFNTRQTLSPTFSLRADAQFSWNSSRYSDPSYPGGLNDTYYIQREAYASTAILYSPMSNLQVSYAADYFFQNLNSEEKMSADCHPLRNAVLQSLSAAYLSERLKATGRLIYSLYFNKADGGRAARDARRLSPSLSLSWNIAADEDLYLRASWKNIFRMPTFTESYYFHYGSKDLRPESTYHYNLGATWQYAYGSGSHITLTADGYFNRVTDMIVAVPYDMHVWTNINVGKVNVWGAELSFDMRQVLADSQSLAFTANYNYQRATDRTPSSKAYGLQIAYTPVSSGAAAISWTNPWVNASLHAYASSMRWSTNEHKATTDIPGYVDTGLTLWHTFKRRRGGSLELRADVNNLLNRHYEVIRLYPMPGINYLISLIIKI